LTDLITLRERNIEPQIIALSAVIGNINDFDNWLGINKLVTDMRPIPLIEGVLDREGIYQFKDPATGEIKTEQLVDRYEVTQRRNKPSSQDLIVPLVRKLMSSNPNEKLIVFRNIKGSAQGTAEYLAADLGLPPASDAISSLPTNDLSNASAQLKRSLEGGTAFHNTNLSRQEREVVEKEFRKKDGSIKALSSTTTMAAGINTPASTVIIAEHQFLGANGRPFSVAEYKNMAGRAGRMGYNEDGRSIMLATHSSEREHLFQQYVLGALEPLHSSFQLQEIETWIIRLLAQFNAPIERGQVVRLLVNTYGGYIAVKADPDWDKVMVSKLEQSLQQMLSLELIQDTNGQVELTLLGRACGRSALSFASMRLIINILNTLPVDIQPRDLMAVVQVIPELDRTYLPLNKRGNSESGWAGMVGTKFSSGVARALQTATNEMTQYNSRCKKALVLDDWINGVPVESIESNYSTNVFFAVNYGDIRSCADGTRFFLSSAAQIALILRPSESLSLETLTQLMKRMEVGLPEDSLDLLNIPLTLERGEYLLLRNAGIRTIESIKSTPREQLDTILGTDRVADMLASLPTH
jgi:replicative superfamily II helicase